VLSRNMRSRISLGAFAREARMKYRIIKSCRQGPLPRRTLNLSQVLLRRLRRRPYRREKTSERPLHRQRRLRQSPEYRFNPLRPYFNVIINRLRRSDPGFDGVGV
jgi:hypothetical protein